LSAKRTENQPPTAVTGQWTLLVRLVKQSIVGWKPELLPRVATTSSSSLENAAFSFSESVNDTPEAAMREPVVADEQQTQFLKNCGF